MKVNLLRPGGKAKSLYLGMFAFAFIIVTWNRHDTTGLVGTTAGMIAALCSIAYFWAAKQKDYQAEGKELFFSDKESAADYVKVERRWDLAEMIIGILCGIAFSVILMK